VDPITLAAELGIAPSILRAWLRRTYPRTEAERGAPWTLNPDLVEAARIEFPGVRPSPPPRTKETSRGRADSDESYVVDLCDEVLGERARRQHRFAWLLGDPGTAGARATLPVDAYYPDHQLVVEYRERQHDEPVAYFDKPDVLTVSGVHRREQRRIYDRRRDELIPSHGLHLVVIRPGDLASNKQGRLTRDPTGDLATLQAMLTP
jgi:hypothetical protein